MKIGVVILSMFFLMYGHVVYSQDYFSDRNNTGTPVIFSQGGEKKTSLFSTNLNLTDASSLKVNFYQQYDLNHTRYVQHIQDAVRHQDVFGWGLSAQAMAENGIGHIFKSGEFKPGFATGTYISWTKYSWNPERSSVFKTFALILSGTLDYTRHLLYYPDRPFADQLTQNTFRAPQIALSAVNMSRPGRSNVYFGGSFAVGRKSNYPDLDTYDIRDETVINNGTINRHVVQTDGDTYATGNYISYTNYRLRFNISYVPGAFGYKLGFVLYPSADFSSPYSTRLNIGLAFHFLQDGNPGTSKAAVFFELKDITNEAQLDRPFLKRSFRLGISTALNLTPGIY